MVNLQKIISSLWCATCEICELAEWQDPFTHITQFVEVPIAQDEPCRLSYDSPQTAQNTDTATFVDAPATLFIRPDLVVKEGSRVTVTQHGRIVKYKASGVPRVYAGHQEIKLTLWDDKA